MALVALRPLYQAEMRSIVGGAITFRAIRRHTDVKETACKGAWKGLWKGLRKTTVLAL